MNKIIKYVLIAILFIGILSFSGWLIDKYNYRSDASITKSELINQFRDSLNSYKIKYDSIIKIQNYTIDSLKNIKKNTIVIYEQAESDFSDRNIISDDSILRYISKKIQD